MTRFSHVAEVYAVCAIDVSVGARPAGGLGCLASGVGDLVQRRILDA
jgi:hypothetical protein